MSDSASRLPAHPSLGQLRKQAKERLEALRADDPATVLADAQYALAQEYGFESWPKLVHHVESVTSSGRLDQFERLANDLLAGYHGDEQALQELIGHFGVSYAPDQLRVRVQSRVNDSRGNAPGDPTLADVRLMVARQYGFESWGALETGLAQRPDVGSDSRGGQRAGPPFYRIDLDGNTFEPQPPLSDRDWEAIFAIMKERRITGINTPAMTDSAMARLARLDFVTSLNVDGARALTDDGLLCLVGMPQLEELDLGGGHGQLSDRGLEVLRHLPDLRRFSMTWAQRVTDAGIANLSFCEHLESVSVMGTPTGDGVIQALHGMGRLTELATGKMVTDDGLLLLHDLPRFKRWDGGEVEYGLMSFAHGPNHLLVDEPFTDRGLASLKGLGGLIGLDLFWHAKGYTAAGLATLSNLPNLGYLGCQGERCDDAAMRSISALPGLRMLMAQGTVASDEGFIALSRSRTVEHIWGRECPHLGGRGFTALADMPALRGLGVSCKGVDDAALSVLPHFPSLRELVPIDVPDAGFRHVGACDGLENLWCMYCRDTGDEATEHIADLKLKAYYAGRTKITDRSLELLGQMASLERIELSQTAGITDLGVAALAKLPRLLEFSISDVPRVTRQGVAGFGPGVRVEYRS